MKFEVEVDARDLLESIDEICKEEAEKIKATITLKSAFVSDIFDIQDNASKLSSVLVQPTDIGIYIFMVNANASVDCKGKGVFDSVTYAAKTNKNLKRKSFNRSDCLYIGKAEKALQKRISEHIGLPHGKKTYSLRLGTPERQHIKSALCLYTFVLKKPFKNYEKVLLPIVEGYLHGSMLPKIGSKRA